MFFTFPSRYLFTIGPLKYLALEIGLPRFLRHFACPAVLRYLTSILLKFKIRGSHPLWRPIPRPSSIFSNRFRQTLQPPPNRRVWAVPFSLTATHGISYDFFSPGYWDVSLPRISFPICVGISPITRTEVTLFGFDWIIIYWQLPSLFRRLSRPSSALATKASTICFIQIFQYLPSLTGLVAQFSYQDVF